MYIVNQYSFWLLEGKHPKILHPVDNGHPCSSANSHRAQAFATRLELDFVTCFRGYLRCWTIYWWQNKASFDKATTNAVKFVSGDRPS